MALIAEPPECRELMLELQVDELTAMLENAETQRRNACRRATYAEQRNKRLLDQIATMEDDFQAIAHCWQCDALGKKECCAKCSNRSVFEKIASRGG